MKEQWREIVLIVFVIALSIFLFTKNAKTVSESIIITEICPSGCAAADYQWIEVYNKSLESVDLATWKFWEGGVNHGLTLSASSTVTSTILLPGSYAIIAQNDRVFFEDHPGVTSTIFDSAWTTLNKTGEEIGIKKGSGSSDFIEQFVYGSVDNTSLERIGIDGEAEDVLQWKLHPTSSTPGYENYWWNNNHEEINHLPTAHIEAPTHASVDESIFFDASASSDMESSLERYQWNIENEVFDGVSVVYVFATTGTKRVTLTVFDSEHATSTVEHIIEILSGEDGEEEELVIADIVINEFVSDPESPHKEWIELYNAGDEEVELDGFTLYDGVGKIASVTGTIESSGFVSIYLTSSKLNQLGDLIVLKNIDQIVVDTISYGDWNDGDVTDNAPAPGKGHSSARVSDGEDTENNSTDFAYTITPTPGNPNNITPKEIPSPPTTSNNNSFSNSAHTPISSFVEGSVLINELVAIPADNESEFVELFNTTNASIFLDGWVLQDGSLAKTILSGIIAPEKFLVIEKPKGSLNNAGDLVTLNDPSGREIDRVVYGMWNGEDDTAELPPKGASLMRMPGRDTGNHLQDFSITETITKGSANVLVERLIETGEKKINTSTTTAPGMSAASGTVYITEIFPNPTGGDEEKEFIEIFNSGTSPINILNWSIGDVAKKYRIGDIKISAHSYYVFYRPVTGISLNNSGEEVVTLFDFSGQVIDSVVYSGIVANDSSFSKFDQGFEWITTSTPGSQNIRMEFVTSTQSGVGGNPEDVAGPDVMYSEEFVPVIVEILPNPVGADTQNEFIELFNPYDHEIVLSGLLLDDGEGGSKPFLISDNVLLKAGEYRSFYSKETHLSLNNTADSVRILDSDELVLYEIEYASAKEGKSYTYGRDVWFWTGDMTPGEKNPLTPSVEIQNKKSTAKVVAKKPIVATTLTDVRNFDVGTSVSLTGTVVVEPGVMSSQYFYIAGSPGLQVYSYKKDFPELARGDMVSVTGELAETSGEMRVKIAGATDITVVGKSEPYVPHSVVVADIDEPYEGWLTEVSGEITGIKGSFVYLDDGTDEIRLYIRGGSGIDKSAFVEGARASVVGIVQETKSGYMISPRDSDDVRVEGAIKGEKIIVTSSEESISKNKIIRAVVLTLFGLVVVLGIKLYGRRIREILKNKIT